MIGSQDKIGWAGVWLLAIAGVLSFFLEGCGLNPDLPKDKVIGVIQINKVKGYIRDCDTPLAVGCARKKSDHLYVIDISDQSGGQTATLEHELKHVYRWMYGFDPAWIGH